MARGKGGNVIAAVRQIVEPIAETMNLMIWDIEYVKEGAAWYLRIYIEKDGGVGIDDCEKFSRAIDGPLDEADPISQSYYMEVSSPGTERQLKQDWHFEKMTGRKIKVRLIRPDENGKRDYEGILKRFDQKTVVMDMEGDELPVNRSEAAYFKLYDEEI